MHSKEDWLQHIVERLASHIEGCKVTPLIYKLVIFILGCKMAEQNTRVIPVFKAFVNEDLSANAAENLDMARGKAGSSEQNCTYRF
ncbi:hypothetical protein GRJ2_000232900 [Grus japonensis]|uniref:Uncharacterized protein n=1 Tax=Grus japonensis TaxID=30415 RepID=A0ABC9VX63_GRUJA